MKRVFINQTGDSNKFWVIEQFDNTYVVTWGKIGTEGRKTEKSFADNVSCRNEIDKLIKEKLKKDYQEVSELKQVPEKINQQSQLMSEELFWEIISLFNWKKVEDGDAVLKPAIKRLASMKIEDIYKFEDILAEKLFLLDGIDYASNIGESSYKNNGEHFSVDYFLYVRCCVVANGKDYFYYILSNPTEMPKDLDFEPLLYLANEAYSKKTKTEDYDYQPKFDYETFSNIEGWKSKDKFIK
jgi:predicted DNA-binding WGR domain protein